MNAQETLAYFRSKAEHEITLPSGKTATIVLPRVRDCIFAGNVPLPVMRHLQEIATQNGDAPDLTPEESAHIARFQDEIVRATLVTYDGQPVTMTLESVKLIDQDDYDALVAYGTRVTPLAASPQ